VSKLCIATVVQVGGTYALPEPSEAYAGEFGGENDALAPVILLFR
jgi:hypothetical protein